MRQKNNEIIKKDFSPYYAVIFTSTQNANIKGYSEMSDKIEALAEKQHGFIGMNSARKKIGITVSYWESLDAIKNWKQQTEHLQAQEKGRTDLYDWYNVKICKVVLEYEFSKSTK